MLDLMGWSQGSERVEVLRKWLSEEPFEWGPAIATRAAFRAIPWLYCQPNDAWLKNFGVQIFHALFIAWSTTSHPVKGHKHAADLSSNLLYPAAMHHASEAYFASGMRQIDYAIIAKAKIDKVDHSIRALVAFENLIKAKAKVVPVSEEFFWSSVQEDVRRISQFRDNKGAKKLLRLDLSQMSSKPCGKNTPTEACLLQSKETHHSPSGRIGWEMWFVFAVITSLRGMGVLTPR